MKYLIIFLLVLLFIPIRANAYGVISDIHAGKQSTRIGLHGKANDHPRKGVKMFQKALKQLKKKGESIVFVLGDSVNNSNNTYAKKLKKVADASKMKIFWIMGNHDPDNSILVPRQHYYFEDIGNTRIIILDTDEIDKDYVGGISQTQMDWLQSVIETDKEVVILQHHPVFLFNTWDVDHRMQPLKDLEDRDNVRYVLSGHWHLPNIRASGKYITFPAFTARGYFIIN